MSDPVSDRNTFEVLLPRLGDYLLQEELISPEDLDKALEIQKVKFNQGETILLGKILLELGIIDPDILDQAITKQIFNLHAALKHSNMQLEERVQERTQDLEARLLQIRTAAEITQIALTSNDLPHLLKEVVNLIVDRFDYYSASIFLVDEERRNVVLAEAAGPFSDALKKQGQVIQIGSQSMVGWSAANNKYKLASDIRQEFFYKIDNILTDTLSEISIPISPLSLTAKNKYLYQSLGEDGSESPSDVRAIGVLDIQQNIPDAFDTDAISVLQTIANHLASVIENMVLLELSNSRLNETTMLFKASQKLAKAKYKRDVETIFKKLLGEFQYPTVLLTVLGNKFHPEAFLHEKETDAEKSFLDLAADGLNPLDELEVTVSQIESVFSNDTNFILVDLEQPTTYPQPIVQLLNILGFKTGVLIPIRLDERVEMVFMIGSKENQPLFLIDTSFHIWKYPTLKKENLTIPFIQANLSLTQLVSNALDRVTEFGSVERRIGALQALNSISEKVSESMDLNDLYHQIHQEISNLMGNVDFSIAIFDKDSGTIQLPYLVEVNPENSHEKFLSVAPFPLGKGLTSTIINSRQPLMINFDAERKALELGGINLGQPAKSWLGVPLLISGEPIGAIIVQDRFSEGRFKADDQRLLVTMAAQVAISIHNARLLEDTTRQAERERTLLEITSKIRNSSDMQSILTTTVSELRKILNVRRARLEIDVDAAIPTNRSFNSDLGSMNSVEEG